MEVVTKVSQLNDVLRKVPHPSEIVDCAGKCIKDWVEARNLGESGKVIYNFK